MNGASWGQYLTVLSAAAMIAVGVVVLTGPATVRPLLAAILGGLLLTLSYLAGQQSVALPGSRKPSQ